MQQFESGNVILCPNGGGECSVNMKQAKHTIRCHLEEHNIHIKLAPIVVRKNMNSPLSLFQHMLLERIQGII
jgi:hypothetical protein